MKDQRITVLLQMPPFNWYASAVTLHNYQDNKVRQSNPWNQSLWEPAELPSLSGDEDKDKRCSVFQ